MKNISFDEWHELAYLEYYKSDQTERLGQWFYNHLHSYKPGLAKCFVAGSLEPDPFFKDEDIEQFLNVVREQWAYYE